MTAPTEAEIRTAVRQGILRVMGADQLDLNEGGIYDILDPFLDSDHALPDGSWDREFSPASDHPGTLWADMRPTEVDELKTGIEDAISQVERAAAEMLERLVVEFAMEFAAKYPDVPRGRWQPEREPVPA